MVNPKKTLILDKWNPDLKKKNFVWKLNLDYDF